MEESHDALPPEQPRRQKRRWWQRVRKLFVWVVLLVVFLLGLLQLPAFQNWLVDRATSTLSDVLESEVSIDYARLSWFDELTLQGVFVEDKYGDTLLYGRSLETNFNLLSLLNNSLEIEEVTIADARFKIRRDLGDPESNLETALTRLFPPRETPGRPLNLDLDRVDLEHITFVQNDSVRGQRMDFYLESGVIFLDELDLPNKLVSIGSAEIVNPVVNQTTFPPTPLAAVPGLDEAIRQLDSTAAESTPVSLHVMAGSIEIIGGAFTLNNLRKDPIEDSDLSAVDFARLDVADIGLELTDLDFASDTFSGTLQHLSLEEGSGFILNRLSVRDLLATPTSLVLNDLVLTTPQSSLSDSLSFTFPGGWESWSEFNDRVRMEINLEPSTLAVRDLLYFARKLRFNPFFRDNRDRNIQLGGNFRGRVNNLRAEDVTLGLDDRNVLAGSFSSRNLAQPGSEALNLKLDRLRTSVATLRRLFPRMNLPPNFSKLGRLAFSGQFDGFFTDFAAKGDLRTDIGRALLDMRMNIEGGVARAEYSGTLSLDDFDLGQWTDNTQLGTVDFSAAINDGEGLLAETASANLTATVEQLGFRDYVYENAVISGRLEQQFFNGSFEIGDDNIDLYFLGELDFRDSVPVFDFAANIREMDLQALNLSERLIVLSGNVDLNLRNTVFSDMEGRVELDSFRVIRDTADIEIGQLLAYSIFNPEGQKVVKLESDIARGEIIGRFDLNDLSTSLTRYLVTYYPGWADRLKIRPPRVVPEANRFSFDLTVVDSRGLNRLIDPKLGPVRDVHLTGSYDGFADELRAELVAPRFRYDNIELVDLIVRTKGDGSEGELDLVIDTTLVNNKPLLDQLTLLSLIDRDTLTFGINYGGAGGLFLDKLNLNGEITLPDSANYAIRFDDSDLVLFQEPWAIRRDNRIVIGPQYIDTRNFSLRSGDRSIQLSKRGSKGLDLNFRNMALGLIDSVWAYQPLDFDGRVNVHVGVDDAFLLTGLSADIRSDTFLINGDDYGYLRVDLRAPDPKGRLTAYLNLNRDTSQLIAEATFNLGQLAPNPRTDQEKNYLDLTVDVNGYPLDLASYWVGGSVSDIVGKIDGRLNVVGPAGQPDVQGYIDASAGAFTLDYLQTRYHFNESRVRITNTLFDLAGTRLLDRNNNAARLTGGITHDRLKNLGISARLTTDRFLALDLSPGQNPNFYGRAIGSGTVDFSGDFRQTDIYVRATVGRDSRLSIPVTPGTGAGPIDNVRFVDRQVYQEEETRTAAEDPTGVSLEMQIEVTDEALGEIIFDEEVGDVLRGQGNGNLTIRIPRDGDLQMYGTITLTDGDYLFTLYKVVNKEFSVRPGGTVSWSGDPFAARIDIAADYQNLKTPIINFVREYLPVDAGTPVIQTASQATDVELTLKLDGILTQPNINFDIAFPSLDGQLENYANNKRRQLLLDQNELNRQVFGLIAVGQFLPADLSFNVADVAVNTVSEWLSTYLSLLLNDLLRDAFGEEAFISGFDFDIAYNNYSTSTNFSNQGTIGRGQAVEFSFRRDFNNRLSLSGDVNVLNNQFAGGGNTGTFIGNDIVLEYVLNDSRSLKLRVYQRRQPDIANGRRLQLGTGLSWKREFDSLSEFFDGFRSDATLRR
ncbi:translocation/assembly module TamB domain-containing protein [Lewinella sp. IMCC34183]|uniref:translocation/assembly module TamB domain-containing protein n=1 Tax=Lewinella sp. IMCC34183 TaxID=2248762 RepID=UPI000E21FF98|nr:translocation/assembly module TamB domain-containing protein [Lewinella sp. IMCC34183]